MKRLNMASLLVAAFMGGLSSAAAFVNAPLTTNRSAQKRPGAGRRSGGSRRKSTYFPPEERNGARECARRCRQIVTGHVQVSA